MTPYCILYQLNTPCFDYQNLISAIELLGKCIHCMENTWLLLTSRTAQEIKECLIPYLQEHDKLLVFSVGMSWATFGSDPFCVKWMKSNWNVLPNVN